ncbi:MAG: hypothetical protein PHC97_01875 [Patescibacteria group bacterium]|nr:hypothetical protein [Patescibacteria group bacterium]
MNYIIFASSYFAGARTTLWLPIAYALGSSITALLSIKYGEGGWSGFDKFCLTGSALGLVLWAITRQPIVALVITIFIDFLGALPTMKKSWHDPKSENKLTWLIFSIGTLFSVLAINKINFAIMILPIYMFLCCNTITLLVACPRKKSNV